MQRACNHLHTQICAFKLSNTVRYPQTQTLLNVSVTNLRPQ